MLDLGCGQGRDALLFARHGCAVVGVDVSQVGVDQLNQMAADEGLDLRAAVGDARSYVPSAAYDVVVLDRVLHMMGSDDERRACARRATTTPQPCFNADDHPKWLMSIVES